jgi:hypothetical protein
MKLDLPDLPRECAHAGGQSVYPQPKYICKYKYFIMLQCTLKYKYLMINLRNVIEKLLFQGKFDDTILTNPPNGLSSNQQIGKS